MSIRIVAIGVLSGLLLKPFAFRIKGDVLVVSCDTITNADLFGLINEFRQHDASLAALFLKGGAEADTVIPGPKTKHSAGK